MDQNELKYTRLPHGLCHSSVIEIVDAYNSLNPDDFRQYSDLIFLKNSQYVGTDLKTESIISGSFGVLKLVSTLDLIEIDSFGSTFQVNLPMIFPISNGLILFKQITTLSLVNFQADFSIFKFK